MTELAERETIFIHDPVVDLWSGWTACPKAAQAWRKSRWPVSVAGLGKDGKPRSWEVHGIPSESVILRPAPRKKP